MSTLKRTKPWLAAALAALLAIITAVPAQADETITYIHWDALGSPVAATDEAGNVVWREGATGRTGSGSTRRSLLRSISNFALVLIDTVLQTRKPWIEIDFIPGLQWLPSNTRGGIS